MFYYVRGLLAHLEPNMAVIEACGVGYQLTISHTTYEVIAGQNLNETKKDVKLYTHFAVREDGVELFGFATEAELGAFRKLITVSGVGPKVAVSVLSLLPPDKFYAAVCTEDTKLIAKASGVGAKTAARIVLELKDKIQKENVGAFTPQDSYVSTTSMPAGGVLNDAMDTLQALGFTRQEIIPVLKDIKADNMALQDIIKAALKRLTK